MNCGHLMNKAHTASHLLVLIIAQQAAQMNQQRQVTNKFKIPNQVKICLPLPHLVSSSGSCGGGVFGFKSRRGFFFSFRIDWSTVPEASAANIIEDLGNFAFEFLTQETRNIDCSYEMVCKRIASVSALDLYDIPLSLWSCTNLFHLRHRPNNHRSKGRLYKLHQDNTILICANIC